MSMTPAEVEALSHWDEVPGCPVGDWINDVIDGNTRESYKEWAISLLEITEEYEAFEKELEAENA